MKTIRQITLTIIITILVIPVTLTQTNPTPTLAPSKTPTLPPNPAITETPNTQQPITPKTQSDLSLLTGNIQRPNGISWLNNRLYTVCSGDWTLYEINIDTGSTAQYIYGIRNAHSIYAINENNEVHLWIPDFQSNTFIHINRGVTEVIASNLQGPWGITPLDDKTFAISNLNNNTITSITKEGTISEIITGLRSPSGIASDSQHIYVANNGSARRAIEWFNKEEILNNDEPTNSSTETTHSLITGLQNTTNLILAPNGNLYFTYALGTRGVVGRINPEVCIANGGCTAEEIEIVLYTELSAPLAGLTISSDMRLYVHTIFSPDIYWVQLDNTET